MSDIEEHRKKIEEITLEMIKLLKTRTNIAKQIGDAKASLGMTVLVFNSLIISSVISSIFFRCSSISDILDNWFYETAL